MLEAKAVRSVARVARSVARVVRCVLNVELYPDIKAKYALNVDKYPFNVTRSAANAV